jgi:hypothetical protein
MATKLARIAERHGRILAHIGISAYGNGPGFQAKLASEFSEGENHAELA